MSLGKFERNFLKIRGKYEGNLRKCWQIFFNLKFLLIFEDKDKFLVDCKWSSLIGRFSAVFHKKKRHKTQRSLLRVSFLTKTSLFSGKAARVSVFERRMNWHKFEKKQKKTPKGLMEDINEVWEKLQNMSHFFGGTTCQNKGHLWQFLSPHPNPTTIPHSSTLTPLKKKVSCSVHSFSRTFYS